MPASVAPSRVAGYEEAGQRHGSDLRNEQSTHAERRLETAKGLLCQDRHVVPAGGRGGGVRYAVG